MICQKVLGCFAMVAICFSCGCNSPYHRDQGTVIGGLTGAAIGTAIGEHNDNPVAGALVGTAVGAMAGNAIGSNMDAQVARNNAIIEQRMGRRLAGAVTVPQVISMSQAQLSDDVIITHIQANGVVQRPSTDDLIVLARQGVSDPVINAMQNQSPVTSSGNFAPVSKRPVVVREHHYYQRPNYCPPPRAHYYNPRPRSGFHFQF